MAAVILASEENNYFGTSALRRSHSQPKFSNKGSGFHSSSSASRLNESYSNPVRVYPDSAPSSASSSPRTNHPESSELSWASTPASNLSVVSDLDDTVLNVDPEDHFVLPQYENNTLYGSHREDLEPPTSPPTGDSYSPSPADNDSSADTSRPGSPENPEPFVDDTAVRAQPSRHVDYLSHNWREEDIWSSWKYIISRRGDYANAERLENASWRTWMKAKNKLKTVSPETLNWLKDCDVTWLYGPLQTGPHLPQSETNPSSSKLSRSNSFSGNKKPILKKRSMSEIMLQRSLSNSSLVKQAAAAVQAQEKEGGRRRIARPTLERAATDYITFPFSSRRMSGNDLSSLSSVDSSGLTSPNGERKHIHFNEQVEQCIAVEIRGDEDDDDLDTDRFPEDSDSDDGGLTMKRSTRRKKLPIKKKSKAPVTSESKIIAMLPSTTLKSREESPDAPETAQKHSVFRSPVISPSSSQETLRPSKVTSKKLNLVFDDDDDDEDDEDDDENEDDSDEDDEDDKPTGPVFRGSSSSSKSGNAPEEKGSSLQRSASTNSLNAEPAGMRRTPSGMFMPYEEGESSATEGIFGRVIDTVNTARDIAHVIWNVGWRK